MKKVGLFGGTFNPVHLGHLSGARETAQSLGLQRVIFMPAARPPHKESVDLAGFEHRRRMLELAIRGNPIFEVSCLEANRPGPSYTATTLKELSRELGPDISLTFIIGAEAFSEIGTWREPAALFEMAEFAVMLRPKWSPERLEEVARLEISRDYSRSEDGPSLVHPVFRPIHFVEITPVEVSGTLIREKVRRGESIKYLVAKEVEGYILSNGLYR